MIKIVKERKNKDDIVIGTHDGIFHCDEMIAISILSILYDKDIYVIRSRDIDMLNDNDCLLVDVGLGEYDHHQKGGNGSREDGFKYASAGLIWKRFGKEVIFKLSNVLNEKDVLEIFNNIDKEVIEKVDILDNGEGETNSLFDYSEYFLPLWNSNIEYDDKFEECINLTRNILKNVIDSFIASYLAKREVKKYINDPKYHINNILIIPIKNLPYLDVVLDYNDNHEDSIDFIAFSYYENGYAVKCVPFSRENIFSKRIPFPEEWAGQTEKLASISGIKSAIFCHNERFFARAEEFDDIINLCDAATRIYLKNS